MTSINPHIAYYVMWKLTPRIGTTIYKAKLKQPIVFTKAWQWVTDLAIWSWMAKSVRGSLKKNYNWLLKRYWDQYMYMEYIWHYDSSSNLAWYQVREPMLQRDYHYNYDTWESIITYKRCTRRVWWIIPESILDVSTMSKYAESPDSYSDSILPRKINRINRNSEKIINKEDNTTIYDSEYDYTRILNEKDNKDEIAKYTRCYWYHWIEFN